MQDSFQGMPVPESLPLDYMRELAATSGKLDLASRAGPCIILEDQRDGVITFLGTFHGPIEAVARLGPILNPEPLPLFARIEFSESTRERGIAAHDDSQVFRIDVAHCWETCLRRVLAESGRSQHRHSGVGAQPDPEGTW